MRSRAMLLLAAVFTSAWSSAVFCAEEAKPAAEQVQPEQLLRQMADYYAALPAFSCNVDQTIRIQARGMDNQMSTKLTVRLERPNRFAMIVQEGIMGMTIVSDGTQVWQYMPMLNRYAVADAPQDLSELESGAAGGFMMGASAAMIPTNGDEFYKTLMEGVKTSEYLGKEKLGDVECHHCRFVQHNFSWEIWIEAGDRPLVHKIAPDLSKQFAQAGETFKDAKIEYTVTFTDWNVEPKFTDADFAFEPPADAQKVDSLFEGLAGGEEGPHPLLGQAAPAFETTNVEGQPINLANHLGKEIIMLDFWATWCGPCVQAMPQVEEVAKKFADRGLVFYAVNAGEDADTIKEFLKTSELNVPVAMDQDGKINGLYGVEGIPQTVLIGKDGKVQVVHIGFSDALGKTLTQNVEDLFAGKNLAAETLAEAEEKQEPASE